MTAHTTPSKFEKNRLLRTVQEVANCDEEDAADVIRMVLETYGVKTKVKGQRRPRRDEDE